MGARDAVKEAAVHAYERMYAARLWYSSGREGRSSTAVTRKTSTFSGSGTGEHGRGSARYELVAGVRQQWKLELEEQKRTRTSRALHCTVQGGCRGGLAVGASHKTQWKRDLCKYFLAKRRQLESH